MWTATKTKLPAGDIYDLVKRHKLEWDDPQATVAMCKGMSTADHYMLTAGDVLVGHLFIAEGGAVDLIPVTKYFGRPDAYADKLIGAVRPVLEELFLAGARRFYSCVPISRPRTKKALKELGFVSEGRPREAFTPFGGAPEDVWILGLIPRDL